MSEELETEYAVNPNVVEAMIGNTVCVEAIASILEAVIKANFDLEDSVDCHVYESSARSNDWEYIVKITLTHIADLGQAEPIAGFMKKIKSSRGLFTIMSVEIIAPVVLMDFDELQA